MALMRGAPLKWSPRGASDTLDASSTFTGAMLALQNLIRDPSTLGLFVCRPASIQKTAFPGFNTPGFISCFQIIGDQAYGLIASALTPGFDQPFCYNITANTFAAVSGITGANVPASPATSGAWVPPTMALIGTKLIVTHPGFPGGAGKYFGWFDISTPATPSWNAGNTATNVLPFAPTAVFQFFNRAYFASGRFLVFSDVLDALTVTNASQALTLGDSQSITALGGLPANNLTGALTQALIVFKSKSSPMQMWQVTGDAALLTLAVNSFGKATGTLAPSTICATPKGLGFMAPDGFRIVDFGMNISDPMSVDGSGISVPFIKTVEPSRMCAACNGNLMRVSTQNGDAVGSPFQEWWMDFNYGQWTGPHTFPASSIGAYLDDFIVAPQGVNAKLFFTKTKQSSTSAFIENGSQMAFLYQTPMLPDTEQMSELTMSETTIDMAYPAGGLPFLVTAGDQNGTLFDSVSLAPGLGATVWGAFNWGQALWLGAASALSPRQIGWHEPLVFRRLYLAVQGNCAAGFKIGTSRLRYQELGYLQQDIAVGG